MLGCHTHDECTDQLKFFEQMTIYLGLSCFLLIVAMIVIYCSMKCQMKQLLRIHETVLKNIEKDNIESMARQDQSKDALIRIIKGQMGS